jgi:hypothetical protein
VRARLQQAQLPHQLLHQRPATLLPPRRGQPEPAAAAVAVAQEPAIRTTSYSSR